MESHCRTKNAEHRRTKDYTSVILVPIHGTAHLTVGPKILSAPVEPNVFGIILLGTYDGVRVGMRFCWSRVGRVISPN